MATTKIKNSLIWGHNGSPSWRSSHFRDPIPGEAPGRFQPGIADFVPGWFMQRQEVIHFPLQNFFQVH